MRSETGFIDQTLMQLLKSVTVHQPDQAAIICIDGKSIDFRTFDQLTDNVAAWLAGQGLLKGDRVGLYCINSAEFALAYFGILKAGCTVVPVNLLLNPKEIMYILSDSGARALVYHSAMMAGVNALRQEASDMEFYLSIGGNDAGDADWQQVISYQGSRPEYRYDTASDLAVIIYTSGTTGQPKGAMLTHRNLAANTWSVKQALKVDSDTDRIVVVLPMFHAFAATVGMLMPLCHGGTFVPVPRFEPAMVADTIAATGATVFMGVPSMYTVLLRLPDVAVDKLKSLRICISGGAAMPVEIMKQFEHKFRLAINEGDGPSECSPVTSVNPIGGIRKAGSIGLPVALVEMKIMDEHGNELPAGENGEICVRGPNVMKGYLNREQETRDSFHGEWFRTGDLGHRDSDGYFYIVDRIKDLIIHGGMNVYPRVIEEVLYQMDAVQECAVVGEPDKLRGEIVVAYVVCKQGRQLSADEVRHYCRDNLGQHEVPRKVFFLEELPRNAAGKILKRTLRRHGEIERGIDIART